MTLEEAIKEMHTFFIKRKKVPDDDLWDACRLGLEALKYIYDVRNGQEANIMESLPGETEEPDEH
jgi:hypothetical protein